MRLDLHRDTQTVWPVRAPTAMHECGFPMPGHPSARAARQRALGNWRTRPEFAKAQRQRKKVEALFAELKNQIGLRRLRLRRVPSTQFFLAASTQNNKVRPE